jgi:hypothetical protein
MPSFLNIVIDICTKVTAQQPLPQYNAGEQKLIVGKRWFYGGETVINEPI